MTDLTSQLISVKSALEHGVSSSSSLMLHCEYVDRAIAGIAHLEQEIAGLREKAQLYDELVPYLKIIREVDVLIAALEEKGK